jgi:hypothetical protein
VAWIIWAPWPEETSGEADTPVDWAEPTVVPKADKDIARPTRMASNLVAVDLLGSAPAVRRRTDARKHGIFINCCLITKVIAWKGQRLADYVFAPALVEK